MIQLARLLFSFLAFGVSAALAAPPDHPLDPLNAEEISSAVQILTEQKFSDAATRYAAIELIEPDKAALSAWKAGDPFVRRAHVVARKGIEVHEAEVDLDARRLVSSRKVEGAQTGVLLEDWVLATELTKANPEWRAAMRKRGYEDVESLFCAPLSIGFFDLPEERGRRLLRTPCYDTTGTRTTIHGRPIEGVFAIVDLGRKEVVRVVDTGVVPVPVGTNRADAESFSTLRSPMRPVVLQAPAGNNFSVNRHQVQWDRWRFHLKLDRRFGPVVSLARWMDEGRERSVLHQGYASEMFVPYMDDDESWYFRSYMDIGEYGFGLLASPLQAGVDCPAHAMFLNAVIPDDEGKPFESEQAFCIFERNSSAPVWRHLETFDESYEGRPEVELVVRSAPTVGNYDYIIDWVFTQRGDVRIDVGATGMDAVKGVAARSMDDPSAASDTRTGSLVAPNTVAVFHDHFISFRLDLDVDGPTNSFVRERLTRRAGSGRTPRTSLWGLERIPMPVEGAVRTDGHHGGGPEVWRVVNPQAKTALGHAPGYQLEADHGAVSLLDENDWPQKRAAFSSAPLWVTAYDPNERYASGPYPNQSRSDEGLPAFVAKGRSVEAADVVLWATLGFHHVTRPEDWPVLPTKWHSLRLRPYGFFTRNPAIDAPRSFTRTQ